MSDEKMTSVFPKSTRRNFLKTGSAGAAAFSLAGCIGSDSGNSSPTESNPLQVEFYGGVFKEVLDEHLVAPFEEETGIPVESSAGVSASEPLKLKQAVDAGEAPIDVVAAAPTYRIRGQRLGVWHNFEPDQLPNSQYVVDGMLPTADDGSIVGLGAFAYFSTMVSQMDLLDDPFTSWDPFWNSEYENNLALITGPEGGIIDVAAQKFFNGRDSLQTEADIEEVLHKVAEITPQVKMWYDGEAKGQQALLDEEVVGSWLYNDVTLVMEENDQPVETHFPEEGPVRSWSAWVSLASTSYPDAAAEFINFSLRPEIQRSITENLYTAPTIQESELNMSDELYQKVYGPGPETAIDPYHEMYIDREEWLSNQWRSIVMQ